MFFKTVIVVFSCISLISGFIYQDCGSEVGEIKSITISNCNNEDSTRCILKRSTNVTMQIQFAPKEDTDYIKAVVHGTVVIPVPFILPNDDGCKDSGITCPISSGQTVQYVTQMPIRSEYPRVTVDIKWELKDKDGKDIICATIPAKIK